MKCTRSAGVSYRSLATLFLVVIVSGSTLASAGVVSLFAFPVLGGLSSGSQPFAGVIADRTGALYGTTYAGGSGPCQLNGTAIGCGTVFKLSPPTAPGGAWTEKVIYSFQGGSDGQNPQRGLVFDKKGALYGTTPLGGHAFCRGAQGLIGCGVVFKLTPAPDGSWKESVIYRFKNGSDGAVPLSSLIFDSAGSLYGTTEAGGINRCVSSPQGCGVVFRLTPQNGLWSETTLYQFQGSPDGWFPESGLIFDSAGNLFGTTALGGDVNSGFGTVFELSPPSQPGSPWTETALYNFQGFIDGGAPNQPLIRDQSGNLYGTTTGAGVNSIGTVFELSPPAQGGGSWTETVIYTFGGANDGISPFAPLLMDSTGKLIGSTSTGGPATRNCPSGCGTLFRLAPPGAPGGQWIEDFVFDFNGVQGNGPLGGIVLGKGGAFYGTTVSGSASLGSVFGFKPN